MIANPVVQEMKSLSIFLFTSFDSLSDYNLTLEMEARSVTVLYWYQWGRFTFSMLPYLRKYNAHIFQPNIAFKIGVRIRFDGTLDSSTNLNPPFISNSQLYRFLRNNVERSRFSAQFVPGISQPRAKTRPPTVVDIFVITVSLNNEPRVTWLPVFV
jgi:hypothetical protein